MDPTQNQPPTQQQVLLQNLDSLVPKSKETSVSTVELFFDNNGNEKLIITVLRFPSGNPGQVRFDYRAGENSKIVDYNIKSNVMESYDQSMAVKSEGTPQQPLDIEETSAWLCSLIERGSVQKP